VSHCASNSSFNSIGLSHEAASLSVKYIILFSTSASDTPSSAACSTVCSTRKSFACFVFNLPRHSARFLGSIYLMPIHSIVYVPSPVKFYKGRSQEKTHLLRLEFFLLHSPPGRARSVLTDRALCSVVGHCDPTVWIFSTSGFHHFFATKPVSSETSKAEPRSIWRPQFYPGLVAHSFFWLSERA
jgi:hypothetical protein